MYFFIRIGSFINKKALQYIYLKNKTGLKISKIFSKDQFDAKANMHNVCRLMIQNFSADS